MEPEKLDLLTWLAGKVAAARLDGGVICGHALHREIRETFPELNISTDELDSALVQATAGSGVAIQFGDDPEKPPPI